MKTNRAMSAKVRALFLSGIAALAVQIPPALAADYGLGVSHGDDTTVLIPIRLESLTVEPEVLFSRSKTKSEALAGSSNSTFTLYGLATGMYARRTLGPSFEGYFGGRVGIQKFRNSGDSGLGTSSIQQKGDSWFAGPTVGLEHYFSKQFSIALDVGLIYDHIKNKSSFPTDQTITTNRVDTTTRMLLRGYF
jgi:hypothetical protein